MGRSVRILLVEDDPLIQNAIREILPDAEYEIEAAEHGKAALQLIMQKTYDVVITDIIMDEMDGIEFIREMKKRNIHIPIIGMSGHAVGHRFLPAMGLLGVKATLLKPFSRDELLTAIEYATTPPAAP